MGPTFEVAEGITAIDTQMAGVSRLTSAYLIESTAPTIIETGPATSANTLTEALNTLGIGSLDLAHVVVTHIHLDHAGGAGHIAELFPNATVWVHEAGARHLTDPSRLMASAARVYGEQRLSSLFGAMKSVAADRIRAFNDGGTIDLGSRTLLAIDTPGHASHHIAIQDSSTGAVFTGDAMGVHLPDVPGLRPAAPPPEFDVEQAVGSIERIRQHARGSLMLSHFGPIASVDDTCAEAVRRINQWSEIVRFAMTKTDDDRELAAVLRRETGEDLAEIRASEQERLEILGSYELNAAGLSRYWRKREARKFS